MEVDRRPLGNDGGKLTGGDRGRFAVGRRRRGGRRRAAGGVVSGRETGASRARRAELRWVSAGALEDGREPARGQAGVRRTLGPSAPLRRGRFPRRTRGKAPSACRLYHR